MGGVAVAGFAVFAGRAGAPADPLAAAVTAEALAAGAGTLPADAALGARRAVPWLVEAQAELVEVGPLEAGSGWFVQPASKTEAKRGARLAARTGRT
jgi:hypothetical protein